MEYWKYRLNSLRIYNLIYGVVLLYLLSEHLLVSGSHFYFSNPIISGCVLLLLSTIFILSFFSKLMPYYKYMLYIDLWITTIGTTVYIWYKGENGSFPISLLLLILSVFSVYSKKDIGKFIVLYLVIVIPFVLMSPISMDLKLLTTTGTFLVIALAYIKSKYDYNIFETFQNINKNNNQLLDNAAEIFLLIEIIYGQNNEPFRYVFLNVNKAFEVSTGYGKEYTVGKDIKEIFPKVEPSLLKMYHHVVSKQESKKTQNYFKDLSKYYEVSAYPTKGNQFAVLLTDITEKKENERKLKYAMKRSKRTDELKIRFLRDVNHRLRTPLNGMMGMLQLIDLDDLNSENKELFDAMLMEMRHSRNIINQISKYVEIQDMDFRFSKIAIKEKIDKIIQNCKIKKKINYVYSEEFEGTELYVEQFVLETVFQEVLLNAEKYTRSCVDICLKFENNVLDASMFLLIDVTNYGIGISDEKKSLIFNEFYHHDFINIYRDESNTSLPMCKQMILSSGGDLLVDSVMGEKTTFTIILPVYAY